MENKYLLKDERIITYSDGNTITLTNLRLRYTDKQIGKAHIISIMLKKVSSIEVKYLSKMVLLILAIIGFVIGLYELAVDEPEAASFALIVGGILIASYFVTRKHVLSIKSDGGKAILFHARGMNQSTVIKFINQVEQAINEIRI